LETRKLPDTVPVDELIVHAPLLITLPLPLREHDVSVDEYPEPEIWTVVPIAPELGVKVTVGPSRVKIPETVFGLTTPVPLPVTVMVYGPGLLLPTTKVPVKVKGVELDVMVQDDCVTGVPEIAQVVMVPVLDS